MAEYGFKAPANDVVQGTDKNGLTELLRVGANATAAQMLPGRLVSRDVGDYDVKEGSALLAPEGWIGYASTPPDFKPATMATAYAVGNDLAIHNGGGFRVRGSLAKGCSVVKGDLLANWTNGQVIGPVTILGGGLALGIPFTKKTSEQTTYIELPADLVVKDVIVDVGTNEASGTIDVGLLDSESGGDPDGFLDAESCAAAGKVKHNMVDATAANNTIGDLLVEVDIKDATGTPVYYSVPTVPGHVCDGTAKTISYTTSNHTIAGTFWVVLVGEGLQLAARAAKTADATGTSANVWGSSLI